MAKSENQKIKLLRLYEILKTETDENHPLKASDLIGLLRDEGIECERKTLYSDIKLLQSYGIDIHTGGYKYYLAGRDLSVGQIRFLIDAAQSAAFLTKKQALEVSASLSMLAGSHKAELLKENVICFDKIKHRNDEALRTVELINRAIENDKKVAFRYFNLEIGGERKYRKNGGRYVCNPMGLIFNGGYYYLVCYSEKYDDLTTYRVDRISDLAEIDEWRIHSEKEKQFTNGDLKNKITAFGMWNCDIEKVMLVFDREYVEDIYDKFGCDVRVGVKDAEHYYITEYVSVSDVFLGWVASFGTHIRIASPESVKRKLVEKLQESLSLYE